MLTSRTPREIQAMLWDEGFHGKDMIFDDAARKTWATLPRAEMDDFAGTLDTALSHVPPAVRDA